MVRVLKRTRLRKIFKKIYADEVRPIMEQYLEPTQEAYDDVEACLLSCGIIERAIFDSSDIIKDIEDVRNRALARLHEVCICGLGDGVEVTEKAGVITEERINLIFDKIIEIEKERK